MYVSMLLYYVDNECSKNFSLISKYYYYEDGNDLLLE